MSKITDHYYVIKSQTQIPWQRKASTMFVFSYLMTPTLRNVFKITILIEIFSAMVNMVNVCNITIQLYEPCSIGSSGGSTQILYK